MKWRAVFGAVVGWSLTACGTDPAVEDGRRAAEALALEAEAVGIAQAFATSYDGVTGDVSAAERAAAQAQTAFSPSGCARVQIRANELRLTLDNCAGPYGMTGLTGTLQATVNVRSTATVEFAMTGDLRTRRSSWRTDVHVTLTATGSSYSAQYTGVVTGTGSLGNAYTVSASGVGSLGADCVQLNGNVNLGVGSEAWSLLIAGYERCAGGCPRAGGSLVLTRPSNAGQTRVQFNGGSAVSVTIPAGRDESAEVACGG